VLAKNKVDKANLDWLIPHQANKRIITSIADMLDFPLEKITVNIEKYGNTSAGTIPLCLWEFEHQFKKGDMMILTAFGGGYTWGSLLLKWAY
jgi:3-oxoacyl-[acyl-carrier-protein] synthase-3